MTFADAPWIDSPLGLVTRGLQAALVVLIGYGAVAGVGGLVVNGLLALPVVFFPALLAWRYDHEVDTRLTLWITLAAVVHVAGFLGPYEARSGLWTWYDQTAHALSASFVAGVGYAVIVALDRHSTRLRLPSGFRFVLTLCVILAFGVAWEIVEFAAGGLASTLGGQSALVQYGIDDTVLDLTFNTLAGALVAVWGTRYFRDLTAIFSR